MQRPERIPAILADLGISADVIAARRLPLCTEPERLELAEIGNDGREYRLTPEAAAAWRRMKQAAAGEGVVLRLISAFRSVDRQAEILKEKLAAGATVEEILKASAPPGYSEHHTGCAIDIDTEGAPPLEIEFERTPAFAWLKANAGRFGFMLSFPQGNRYGYQYEPWHWFYSGPSTEREAELAGLRVVALFEAFKGTIVLIAGFGLAHAIRGDVGEFAEHLVHRLHLNAAKRFPRIFIDLANNLSDGQLWALAALALAYSVFRFTEAYGLWFERRWGEWIAALSGGIYVPVEIYELSRGFSMVKLAALILNALVVAYMCYLLLRRRTTS